MSLREWCTRRTEIVRAVVALALLALLGSAATRGDDRDLLHTSTADPYMFILLDTSGSMSWAPPGAACPNGDCAVPLNADDPASKAYQARQALYEVLSDPSLSKVYMGFGTYNQDALGVVQKHWLYQAQVNGVQLSSAPNVYFPAVGAQEVFGTMGTWVCASGGADGQIGCTSTTPANLATAWEATRVQRVPKGGVSYSQAQTVYVKSGATTYKATYTPSGGSYGGNLTVQVAVLKCNNASCSTTSVVAGSPVSVLYKPVSDFVSWEFTANRTPPQSGYFDQAIATDSTVNAASTCLGWDPTTDTATDAFSGYDLRWPTATDSRGASFDVGDIIPLDWTNDHKVDILKRMAPNYVDATTVPDYRTATYFNDNRQGSDAFLRLKDPNRRPLVVTGATPLGASVQAFRTWYSGCAAASCKTVAGWAGVAGAQDSSFQCRQKYLLIITDGDESCGGDPCAYTSLLKSQYGVTTFVVAFGVTAAAGNKLSCMTDPDKIFYPQNKTELVDALKSALDKIKEQTSSFASAAVPSVQADVADSIYLSSFTPLNDAAYWDGHLDAYLKPIPLTSTGKPDTSKACSGSLLSSCHLWDAGTVMMGQAPTASDIAGAGTLDAGILRLGLNDNQRRVFYTQAGTGGVLPSTLRLFAPPPGDPKTDPNWADLFAGFNFPTPVTTTDYTNAQLRANNIMANVLKIKDSVIQVTGQPDQPVSYILGDIFHSNPVLVDRPNDFTLYTSNLYASASTSCTNNPGYQCFAQQQSHRRKMLLVGANDGQLHAFDAGVWNGTTQLFTSGTGEEIFSYIPRLALPLARTQVENGHQVFSVDGTPRVSDVFIDPKHAAGAAVATDREWRTVAVGGFREGGSIDSSSRVGDFVSGYYALDLTHPDKLDSSNNPISTQAVPGCLTVDNSLAGGCGTLPFPAVLWEFTDSSGTSQLDEDQNGYADLGQTWSVPTLGRIKVIENGQPADKFVAVFGGGMDANNKTSPKRGNWIYMVDIETGQAIYKRKLVGAAPADISALDTDLDGYLDTLYIGTTSGFLYKASIGSAGTLQAVTLTKTQAVPALAANISVKRVTDTSWDPFPIFDTQNRPIYFSPTIFYVARLGKYALGFGTGDRENLWNLDSVEGRFYMIIDDGFTSAMTSLGTLPKTETNYQVIDSVASNASASADFVVNPNAGKDRGWVLTLDPNERVITQTFGLSGIIIFSTFQPQVITTNGACARGGSSDIYVVYANTGNSVMLVNGTPSRFRAVPVVVTNPYVEQGSTKNAPSSGTSNTGQLDATQQQIMQAVKQFFPKGTKFANYWIRVSGIGSDTGPVSYGTIPVGIVERNWKEQ
jgi:Tfp pilus tip-associated adhesin PilY1